MVSEVLSFSSFLVGSETSYSQNIMKQCKSFTFVVYFLMTKCNVEYYYVLRDQWNFFLLALHSQECFYCFFCLFFCGMIYMKSSESLRLEVLLAIAQFFKQIQVKTG